LTTIHGQIGRSIAEEFGALDHLGIKGWFILELRLGDYIEHSIVQKVAIVVGPIVGYQYLEYLILGT